MLFDFCLFQETRSSLTDQVIEKLIKREDGQYEKGVAKRERIQSEEIWECECWEIFKADDNIKNFVRISFTYEIHFLHTTF